MRRKRLRVLDPPLCTRGEDETAKPESTIRRVQLVLFGDRQGSRSGSRIRVTTR